MQLTNAENAAQAQSGGAGAEHDHPGLRPGGGKSAAAYADGASKMVALASKSVLERHDREICRAEPQGRRRRRVGILITDPLMGTAAVVAAAGAIEAESVHFARQDDQSIEKISRRWALGKPTAACKPARLRRDLALFTRRALTGALRWVARDADSPIRRAAGRWPVPCRQL